MSKELFVRAEEVAGVLGISKPYAYKLVREMNEELKQKILAYLRERVAKYAMPYDVEFREQLPKTLVGKIAYTVLEKEEEEKRKAAEGPSNNS